MEARTTVRCRGHPFVRGTHRTTFEVTRETRLTENGDCIIGVGADRGCAGLPPAFRSVLAHDDAVLETILSSGGEQVTIRSRGSARMLLDHPSDLVWRRSSFVCGRTVGIMSDRTACSLPRTLIRNLTGGKELEVILIATRPG